MNAAEFEATADALQQALDRAGLVVSRGEQQRGRLVKIPVEGPALLGRLLQMGLWVDPVGKNSPEAMPERALEAPTPLALVRDDSEDESDGA